MKNYIITITAIITMAFCFTLSSCKAQTPNFTVDETAVTYFNDCTDTVLFNQIYKDYYANLGQLSKNLGIGQIKANEKLTVRIGAIDDSDRLSLKTASICAASKRASKREQVAQSNPQPLIQMVNGELKNQKRLSERHMASSPIIGTMLKAFREMNPEATREILVVCSDGVEFSGYANLYKSIPTTDEAVAKVVGKLDGILLAEAKERIAEVRPQVVFVLKPNTKAKTADLKQFYLKLLNQIGVTSVSFIDDMTNNPHLSSY